MTDIKLPIHKRFVNLSGCRFGKLLVIMFSHSTASGKCMYKCLCDCGNKTVVRGSHLTTNKIKSCGCINIQRMKTHGKTDTREYSTWRGMKQRCTNPKLEEYKNYGGRGITICDRWLNSFENFYEDMGERPEGYSIERINNNGDYDPSNCRWANRLDQQNNTRVNILVPYDGKMISLKQACRKYGKNYRTVYDRVARGIDIIFAIGQPTELKWI